LPIRAAMLPGEPIILVVLTGAVTGQEFIDWRLAWSAAVDMSQFDILYDLLGYIGSVSDDDLVRLARVVRDKPTRRRTAIATRDPMFGLWMRSWEPRAGAAFPGRPVIVVSSVESGLALLRRG